MRNAVLAAFGLIVSFTIVVNAGPTEAQQLPPGWRLLYHNGFYQPPQGCGTDIGSWFDWDCISALEGGTVGQLRRRSGVCTGIEESYSIARLDKDGPFFAPVDLKWETTIVAEAGWARYYYDRYLERSPSCSELSNAIGSDSQSTTSTFFMHSIACSQESANRGNRPDLFCDLIDAMLDDNKAAQLGIAVPGVQYDALYKVSQLRERVHEVLPTCPDDPANRVMVLNLNLTPPGQSQGIRDIRATAGRPLNPYEYGSYRFQSSMPTHETYETLYYVLAVGGMFNYSWLDPVWLNNLHTQEFDDIVCSTAKYVNDPDVMGGVARYEADAMLRDFFDYAGDAQLGNDEIPLEANLWDLLLFIAMSGASEWNPQWGYTCEQGDACYSAVADNFSVLVEGGGPDTPPPSCNITGPSTVQPNVPFVVQWTASNAPDGVYSRGWTGGPFPSDVAGVHNSIWFNGAHHIPPWSNSGEWQGQWGGDLRLSGPGTASVTMEAHSGGQMVTCSYTVRAQRNCGLGAELVLVLPPLMALRKRVRRRRNAAQE